MVGVAVSFVLFSIIRAFAKGSPGTMNKEYQEATNEYLKVCLLSLFPLLFCILVLRGLVCYVLEEADRRSILLIAEPLLIGFVTGTKLRTDHRYLIRRLLGQRTSTESSQEERIKRLHSSIYKYHSFPLFLRTRGRGLCTYLDFEGKVLLGGSCGEEGYYMGGRGMEEDLYKLEGEVSLF